MPILVLMLLAVLPWVTPQVEAAPGAQIAIIIDDLGYNWPLGEQALSLPGAITYSILPHAPHSARLAQVAHSRDKEIMIHVPMASVDPTAAMEPDSLHVDLGEDIIRKRVDRALAVIPHAKGFNNHMGSLATSDRQLMDWVMSQAKSQDLYFVDSRTTVQTQALKSAQTNGLGALERDLFLDSDPSPRAIADSFVELVALAKKRGYAIAIGHPYPATLEVLAKELGSLAQSQVQLVPVSTLIASYGLAPVTVAGAAELSNREQTNQEQPNQDQSSQKQRQELNLEQLGRWLNEMPPPVSRRLNFSN